MNALYAVAGCLLAVVSGPLGAQQAPAAGVTCYIEVRTLMAEPPKGIGDLGSALHELGRRLQPQVEEIAYLKEVVAELEARHQLAIQRGEEGADPVELNENLRKVRGDLDAKRAQLRLDYATQQQAIVGPVQVRIGQRAQAFAAARGCARLKMARTPDLTELTSTGARNVTGEFVAWYPLNKS